jgi:porin
MISPEMIATAPPAAAAEAAEAAQTPAPSPTNLGGDRAKPAAAGPPVGDITADSLEGAGLLGDALGVRPWLGRRGLDLSVRYDTEAAYNPGGGSRHLVRDTGQFNVTLKADMGKLAGLNGGTFQAAVTLRHGRNLGADAQLGVLEQVQEVYGRGQTLRLTQFWYEQQFGRARLKLGRSSPGEDFQGFSCNFQNLSFCGSQPGNLVGDYWYNWPVSQWSARLRLDGRTGGFAQVGAYEVNPRNLSDGFFNWRLHGQTGVLVPVEVGWTGPTGRAGRLGSYRIGGWWTSADGEDLLLDVNHLPRVLTGAPALERSGRYGGWLSAEQQLTGHTENGKVAAGLTVYLNATRADRATSLTDYQVAVGAIYKGLLPSRPADSLGVGVALTHLNDRGFRDDPALERTVRPDAEYASEIYYGFRPTRWLDLRPNLQFIHHPGGRRGAHDATVIGLKAALIL